MSLLTRFWREYKRRWHVRDQYELARESGDWVTVVRLERAEPWLR